VSVPNDEPKEVATLGTFERPHLVPSDNRRNPYDGKRTTLAVCELSRCTRVSFDRLGFALCVIHEGYFLLGSSAGLT
jgi:hypothetical protein